MNDATSPSNDENQLSFPLPNTSGGEEYSGGSLLQMEGIDRTKKIGDTPYKGM
jgi:hypothetical protein